MINKWWLVLLTLVIASAGFLYWALNYLAFLPNPQSAFPISQSSFESNSITPKELEIEVVAENLYVPWSLVFTSPQRFLLTERSGAIRVIDNGQLSPQALLTFSEISTRSEEGLMGLVLDPEYEQNKYLYTCVAYPQQDGLRVKVLKLKDEGSSIVIESTLVDNIPAAINHAGCRLKFGPDQKLYITTGDATQKKLAQDLKSLAGKILRVNTDGSVPSDNPFPDSLIFSYGHRNPQGLDWHPVTQVLVITEHGPSVFDGPAGGDEINIIQAGRNYGWPLVSHTKSQAGLVSPALVFTPAVAPAAGNFYTSDVIPQFKNMYFFGALRGEGIYQVQFDDQTQKVIAHQKLPQVDVGRVREVIEGPDGFLYFTTSNRDGRGTATEGDDKIYRIIPKE